MVSIVVDIFLIRSREIVRQLSYYICVCNNIANDRNIWYDIQDSDTHTNKSLYTGYKRLEKGFYKLVFGC